MNSNKCLNSLKSLVCLLFRVREPTSFTWNSTLWFSFNHIISLIHPPIRKLKALAHKFSISWEMCAHDRASMPNLHHYQLWPNLAERECDQTIDTLRLTPGQRLGSNLPSFDVSISLWQPLFYIK